MAVDDLLIADRSDSRFRLENEDWDLHLLPEAQIHQRGGKRRLKSSVQHPPPIAMYWPFSVHHSTSEIHYSWWIISQQTLRHHFSILHPSSYMTCQVRSVIHSPVSCMQRKSPMIHKHSINVQWPAIHHPASPTVFHHSHHDLSSAVVNHIPTSLVHCPRMIYHRLSSWSSSSLILPLHYPSFPSIIHPYPASLIIIRHLPSWPSTNHQQSSSIIIHHGSFFIIHHQPLFIIIHRHPPAVTPNHPSSSIITDQRSFLIIHHRPS